jgi:hypothetical protein
MLGAIIGDIVGSRFEFDNFLNKKFDFLYLIALLQTIQYVLLL